jgi:oligo-1,6-glucosidase
MKKAFTNWQYKLAGRAWNMLYLENHDHPRIISRYGSEKFWKESGKTLATALLFQQGTPFIYQGQEIGMLNWQPEDPDMYEDVQTRYTYAHSNLNKPADVRLKKMWRSSRDSARTLIQWNDTENAGFTTSGKPWFHCNPNYTHINVAQQESDPGSILHFYRKAIALRKALPVVRHGTYREHFRRSGKHYVYSREMAGEKMLVICSFCDHETRLPLPRSFDLSKAELLLCNYTTPRTALQPWECRVYHWSD